MTFNSFSGHLNSEMPLTLHSGSRRALRAELGAGGDGELRFKTFSGSVKIDLTQVRQVRQVPSGTAPDCAQNGDLLIQ